MHLACVFLLLAQSSPPAWQPAGNGDPNWLILYEGDKQLGNYSKKEDLYYPLDPWTGRFGPPCPPPIEAPGTKNYGVKTSEISKTERLTLSGQSVSVESAIKALTSPDSRIPASSEKYRIVVVGNEDAARQAADKITACLSETELQTTIVQYYAADHWYPQQAGLDTSGKLAAYLLGPDGKDFSPDVSVESGPEQWVEASRVKRPDFKPVKPVSPKILGDWSKYLLPSAVPAALVFLLLLVSLIRR